MNYVNIDSNNKHLLAQASYAFRYHKMFISAQEIGNCIVCGTTNLDEFSFSGWFGKHSDMVVDIQPIIDMHKSEVYLASKELNIPDSIVKREPQGDLIDGSSDVENFGCSYDELSFISYIMCHQYKDTKFDDNKLEIIKYIKEYGSASRKEIISLLKDKLPNSLDEIGKINRVRYLLNILKKQGKIYNDAELGGSCWKVK